MSVESKDANATGRMVMVASKLPMALRLQLQRKVERRIPGRDGFTAETFWEK